MPETFPSPIVSVIVPAYNSAAYLAAALESLRRQTLRELEIIVVDDGSTDATLEIARHTAQQDSRIRIVSREVASGRPACARNDAIRIARGVYVAFLDSDDIALPTRLEYSITALRTTGAPLVFADFARFVGSAPPSVSVGHLRGLEFPVRAGRHLQPLEGGIFRCRPGMLGFLLAETMAMNIQTVVFARSLLQSGEDAFDETLVGGEDSDLFYRLVTRGEMLFINETQTYQRVHANSLTTLQAERCIADAILVRYRNLRRVEAGLSSRDARTARVGIASSWYDLGYDRRCEGRVSAARYAFRRSFEAVPSQKAVLAYLKTFAPRRHLTSIPTRD